VPDQSQEADEKQTPVDSQVLGEEDLLQQLDRVLLPDLLPGEEEALVGNESHHVHALVQQLRRRKRRKGKSS